VRIILARKHVDLDRNEGPPSLSGPASGAGRKLPVAEASQEVTGGGRPVNFEAFIRVAVLTAHSAPEHYGRRPVGFRTITLIALCPQPETVARNPKAIPSFAMEGLGCGFQFELRRCCASEPAPSRLAWVHERKLDGRDSE
jgi:hypothetical protein